MKRRFGAFFYGVYQVLGGRHKDDRGLYVSTSGFTKDARFKTHRLGRLASKLMIRSPLLGWRPC